ncbi:MAG: REP-associated tyrosine transposase [Ruegeria sp.]
MTQKERPFWCDAFVVLPDHLHAVWTFAPGDADYSTRWGAIKARFFRRLNEVVCRPGFNPAPVPAELPVVTSGRFAGLQPGLRADKREAPVWQRRFWEHCIRDDRDYRNHMAYCWG